MLKNKKTIFTALITVLFVLSVSYFALLAPTTAWFFQDNDYSFDFSFKNFDQSVDDIVTENTIPLRAATRFADAGEWLFDEVAYAICLETTNTETADDDLVGIVNVNVTGLSSGIRWFAFAADSATYTEPTGSTARGTYKPAIEDMLEQFGVDVRTYGGTYSGATVTESAYTTYNTDEATPALNASHGHGFIVEPGETKYIYVVFWAEFGDLKTANNNTAEGILAKDVSGNGVIWPGGTYSANISVTARPYLGKYAKTVTVTDNEQQTSTSTTTSAYSEQMHTLKIEDVDDSDTITIYYGNDTAGIHPTVSEYDSEERAVEISVPHTTQLRVETASGLFEFDPDDENPIGAITGTADTIWSVASMEKDLTLTVGS